MDKLKKSAYLIINAQIFPINKPVVKIGRKLDNDLVIQDVLVSRNHAEIHFLDGKYHIKDLESTGGTFLNNKQITEAPLFSNDLILIANTPMMFIIEEADNIQKILEKKTGTLKSKEQNSDEEETDNMKASPTRNTGTLQFPVKKPNPKKDD